LFPLTATARGPSCAKLRLASPGYVAVRIHRERDGRMPERFHYEPWVNALGNQQRGCRVTQIAESRLDRTASVRRGVEAAFAGVDALELPRHAGSGGNVDCRLNARRRQTVTATQNFCLVVSAQYRESLGMSRHSGTLKP
jgi:hypothetical protein